MRMLRKAKRCAISAGLGLAIVLSGCDDSPADREQAALEQAQAHLNAGDSAAAIIELKNALQLNPDAATTRALLGELYFRSGDGQSAIKELERARALGETGDKLRLLLAESRLLVGEYQAVLDEIPADQPAEDEIGAGLVAARGQALFGLGQFAEAEETLQRAAASVPVPQAYHGLGRLALFQRDPAAAAVHIDAGLEKFPDNAPLQLLKGEQLLQAREFEAARALFEKLEKADPDNLPAGVGLARAELALNRPEPARLLIDDLMRRFPNNHALTLLRAVAALQAKDYVAAQADANIVRSAMEDNAPALYVAGAASFGLDQYEQASRALTRYVAIAPGDMAGRKLLAATQVKLGDPQAARQTLGNVPEAADPGYLSLLGTAAALSGDVASGLQYLEQAVLQSPEDAKLRAKLGVLRLAAGDPTQAQADLDQALSLDPSIQDDPRYDRAEITVIQQFMIEGRFDDALAAIETWKERHPGDATGFVMQGIALSRKGDTAAARTAFEEALKLRPGAADAAANLAILHSQNDDPQTAQLVLEQALAENPGNLRLLLLLSQLAARSGDVDKTRRWLEQAVEANPGATDARIFLARLYFDMGEPQKAIDMADQALLQAPDNPAALEITARSQLESGRIANAVATYERLVKVEPQAVQPKFELSQAYAALGELDEARRTAEAAVAIEPDHAAAQLHLARVLLRQGDTAAAEPVIAKLEAAYPDAVDVRTLRADLTLAKGDPKTALEQFQAARSLQDSTQLAAAVARTQGQLGDHTAAIKTLEDWIAANPKDTAARLELHGHYLAAGQTQPAEANLREIVAYAPDTWQARLGLAALLHDGGDAAAARPEAERAAELAPDNPWVMDRLGLVLLELGETDRAIGLIRRAADTLPDNPQMGYHLARAYSEANRPDEARDLLTNLLQKHQSFEDREAAQALLDQLRS